MKRMPWILPVLWIGVSCVLCLSASPALATLYLIDEFDYLQNLLTETGFWAAHSGGGTNPIALTPTGLSYPGYASAGRAASMTTSGEDDHTTTTMSHTSGAIYLSFLADVSAAQGGDYFIHFYQSSSLFYGRVFCKSAGQGLVQFGITHGAGTANYYTGASYALGTPHLLVVRYTMNPGTLNDTADLWIDPQIGPNEPPPLVSSTDTGSADGTNIIGVALRQGSSSAAPTQVVDGIHLATTWSELFPTEPTGACCRPDGFCTITTQSNCGFDWHPEWAGCDPNPCPQPIRGACCLTGGVCTVLEEPDCVAQGGIYQGDDTDCSPNPCPIPQRTLCEVAADSTSGVPLLVDQRAEVEGIASIANGVWNPTTNQFEISDGACCVSVFGDSFTVPVQAGDLVRVRGTIEHFFGLTEISSPDLEITILSSGHPVYGPGPVTTGELAASGEAYEACLVSIHCASLVDTLWPADGQNANITIDDGSGPVTLRIDKDTNIDGSPRPTGPIDIVGLAYQFDTSRPFTEGYQVLPRSLTDITHCVIPQPGACCFGDGSCRFLLADACADAGGSFLGEGGTCEPNPCPPAGACCLEDGTCILTLESECAHWQGPNVPCTPDLCEPTAVGDDGPLATTLGMRVAPTPFAGQTALVFAGPPGTDASLLIVDASGRKVRTGWAGTLNGRTTRLVWDGRDDAGREVANGMYLAKLHGGSRAVVVRMVKAR